MKVISFFSAKGGTGKTTFNVLLASYIQYRLGKRVMILDFDYPEYNLAYMRRRDLRYMEREGILYSDEQLYPIEEVERKTPEQIRSMAKAIRSLAEELDYMILDFPGSFATDDAVCELVLEKAIDLIIIPVELDPMNIASMRTLARILQENGQRTMLFFNRVQGTEPEAAYVRLREWFAEDGARVSEHVVKHSVSMKKERDEKSHVRSTVDFPLAYANKRNPGIIKLFDEILAYVEMDKKKKKTGNA